MPLRVLIVDDSQPFLAAATALLEREQLDVVGRSTTSADALRQAQRLSPDVVLVDVALGRESGPELARQLAAVGNDRALPVILISTRSEEDVFDLVADTPAVGFLAKSELCAAAIERVLDGGRE